MLSRPVLRCAAGLKEYIGAMRHICATTTDLQLNKNHPKSAESGDPRKLKIQKILNKIDRQDGLPPSPLHIQGLIKEPKFSVPHNDHELLRTINMAGLDIADKTQLILASRHPVKYIIQR